MGFFEELKHFPWEEAESTIYRSTAADVERVLRSGRSDGEAVATLLSPAAEGYLEDMARRAHRLTEQRFGKVVGLFAPLYLSNVCTNACLYCGFNVKNPAARITLTPGEAAAEAGHLHREGFRHILLVSGEAPGTVTREYLFEVLERIRPLFASISVEIHPMDTEDYAALASRGVDGLVVYQETYHEKRYGEFHPAGPKADFRRRLETPGRGGEAGLRRIGIGSLLGLSDWRVEGFFLALHARYLLRHFWKSHVTVSFPRLQPAKGGFDPPFPVADAGLVQLMTALRLCLPDAGLVLSTREPADLRDNLIPLGVTSMSAGSRTDPGGYLHEGGAEEQFAVADHRSAAEVAEAIRRKGCEPVWKDWDAAFLAEPSHAGT